MMPLALADKGSENCLANFKKAEGAQASGGSGLCGRRQRHRGVRLGRQPHREGEGVPRGYQRRNGKKNYDIKEKMA